MSNVTIDDACTQALLSKLSSTSSTRGRSMARSAAGRPSVAALRMGSDAQHVLAAGAPSASDTVGSFSSKPPPRAAITSDTCRPNSSRRSSSAKVSRSTGRSSNLLRPPIEVAYRSRRATWAESASSASSSSVSPRRSRIWAISTVPLSTVMGVRRSCANATFRRRRDSAVRHSSRWASRSEARMCSSVSDKRPSSRPRTTRMVKSKSRSAMRSAAPASSANGPAI